MAMAPTRCCCCRSKAGVEKYIDGKWQVVEPGDRLRLTQQDGQVRCGGLAPVCAGREALEKHVQATVCGGNV